MKVLFQSRPTLFRLFAGDTVQIQETQKALKVLGVDVDISLDNDVNLDKYDIVHIFNTYQVHHSYQFFLNAKKYKKPFVLTPIYIDLDEYNKKGRVGLDRYVYKILKTEDNVDYIKRFVYRLRYGVRVPTTKLSYFQQQEVLFRNADAVCFLSDEERCFLKERFFIEGIECITFNGVAPLFIGDACDWFGEKYGLKDIVLSVGKIEPLKNQIAIINALCNEDFSVVFVGRPNLYHKRYWNRFRKLIYKYRDRMIYIEQVDAEKLASVYRSARVHILASWFENAPLVNLEAGIAGCNLVSTDRGFGVSYLPENSWICNPVCQNSIKTAVIRAYNSSQRFETFDSIGHYTWKNTAEKLCRLYESLI